MYYPCSERGGPEFIGEGEGEGYNLNIAFNEKNIGDEEYLKGKISNIFKCKLI